MTVIRSAWLAAVVLSAGLLLACGESPAGRNDAVVPLPTLGARYVRPLVYLNDTVAPAILEANYAPAVGVDSPNLRVTAVRSAQTGTPVVVPDAVTRIDGVEVVFAGASNAENAFFTVGGVMYQINAFGQEYSRVELSAIVTQTVESIVAQY